MTFPLYRIPEKLRPVASLAMQKGLGFHINDDTTFSFVYKSGRLIGRFSDVENAKRYLEKQPNIRR